MYILPQILARIYDKGIFEKLFPALALIDIEEFLPLGLSILFMFRPLLFYSDNTGIFTLTLNNCSTFLKFHF